MSQPPWLPNLAGLKLDSWEKNLEPTRSTRFSIQQQPSHHFNQTNTNLPLGLLVTLPPATPQPAWPTNRATSAGD